MWIIVAIIAIALAIRYWETILGFGVLGLVLGLTIYLIVKAIEKNKRLQEEEDARKAAEEARIREQKVAEEARIRKHKEDQYMYKKEMIVLGDNSIALFESMPEHLKLAEEYLNQAEFEFSDGAFAPFWDAIEKTAKTLGRFDEAVRKIKNNASQYTDLIRNYENLPPQFPLARKSVEKLSVGTATAERMKEIVRTAQRNFQFATIYEQRKTNQILVAGFTNLAQALDLMTWQITDSVGNLAGSVDSMALALSKSMNAIHSRLGDMAESNIKHNSKVVELASDRVAREKTALDMLDNIQRHRKPLI